MTELLNEPRFGTQPTSDRKEGVWRAVIHALSRETAILRAPMRGVDAPVYPDDLRTDSFLRTTRVPGSYDIDIAFCGEGELALGNSLRTAPQWVVMHEVGHAWDAAAELVKTDPLPDEVANLYISFFKMLRPRPQPEPVFGKEETVDWEFAVRAPRSPRSGRIKVRLRKKGPAKPRRDDTPWD